MENHNLILCHLLKNISVELAYMFWMSIPKHLSVLLDIKSSMNLKVLKLKAEIDYSVNWNVVSEIAYDNFISLIPFLIDA